MHPTDQAVPKAGFQAGFEGTEEVEEGVEEIEGVAEGIDPSHHRRPEGPVVWWKKRLKQAAWALNSWPRKKEGC